MTGVNSGMWPPRRTPEVLIEQAIREYPARAGRPDWLYGLDDQDFEDFVPELAAFIRGRLAGT